MVESKTFRENGSFNGFLECACYAYAKHTCIIGMHMLSSAFQLNAIYQCQLIRTNFKSYLPVHYPIASLSYKLNIYLKSCDTLALRKSDCKKNKLWSFLNFAVLRSSISPEKKRNWYLLEQQYRGRNKCVF